MPEHEKTDGAHIIRNKDIPLLDRVLDVMKEVQAIEERIAWQRDRMTSLSQKLSGMPSGGGNPKGLDDAFVMIAALEEEQEDACKQYVRELRQAEKILNDIESVSMRAFVTMRYVMGIGKTQIMRDLNMTEWGYSRAKECVEDAPDMRSVAWKERFILEKTQEK